MRERNYAEVIRTARQAQGMNQQTLAEKVGVSRNTVAGWETGHSRPDLNSVVPLCRALRLSLNSFFGMKSAISAEDRRLLDRLGEMEASDREILEWEMEAILQRRMEKNIAENADRVISLFRNELGAAAGFGGFIGETQGEEMDLLRNEKTEAADEVIAVSGRSMEPTFLDGDLVLVQHTQELREGEIGIFLCDGEGYIKEYRRDGLHSHNPMYGILREEDFNRIQVIGRVLGKVEPGDRPTEKQIRFARMAKQRRMGK